MQDIEFGRLGLKKRIQKILILGFLLMASVSFSGCQEIEPNPASTSGVTGSATPARDKIELSQSARRKVTGLLKLRSPDSSYSRNFDSSEEQELLKRAYEELKSQVGPQRIYDQFLPTGMEVAATASDRQAVLEVMRARNVYNEELLLYLPDEPSVYDEVFAWYDQSGRPENVGRWLMRNSTHLRKQLLAKVSQVKEKDGYIDGELDLRALARLDWEAAEKEIRRLRSPDRESLNALGLALEFEASASDAAKEALLVIAEDRTAAALARHYAVEGLLSEKCPGRDELYLRLFRDSTLRELVSGHFLHQPLQEVVWREPEEWIPIIVPLVGDPDPAVHDNAVAALIHFHLEDARADALQPLLPWLKEPNWSRARDRLRLIQSLDRISLPGAGPGLAAAVENSIDDSERSYAAESLAAYPESVDQKVILKALEAARGDDERTRYLKPLLASGYYSADEQAGAIVAFSKKADEFLFLPGLGFGESDTTDQALLGSLIFREKLYTNAIASVLLTKLSEMQDDKEKSALERVVVELRNPLVEDALVASLSDENGSVQMIAAALRRRGELSKSKSDVLQEIAAGRGLPRGLATVILQSNPTPVLSGDDVEAQAAFLAGARLVGDPLPVTDVEKLFGTAAEPAARSFLVSLDSPEAVAVLRRRGYSRILGRSGGELESLTPEWETELQKVLEERRDLTDIYALFTTGYYEAYGQFVVLVGDGTAEFRWFGGAESYRTRVLSSEQREAFLGSLTALEPDEMRKLNELGGHNAEYQFLHLTRESGRRVYFFAPEIMGEAGEPYAALANLFKELLKNGTEKRSRLVDVLPGAKILIPGTPERFIDQIRGAEGGALYVRLGFPLLGPSFLMSESGRGMSLTENTQWYEVAQEKLVPAGNVPWESRKLPNHRQQDGTVRDKKRSRARFSGEPGPL